MAYLGQEPYLFSTKLYRGDEPIVAQFGGRFVPPSPPSTDKPVSHSDSADAPKQPPRTMAEILEVIRRARRNSP